MKPARIKNFHVPLPQDTYTELQKTAEALRVPATRIVRGIVTSWLKNQKRSALKKKIQAYANEVAGTSDDLDSALEEAGIELWLASDSER